MKVLRRKYNFLRDVSSLPKNERIKYLNECRKENIDDICEAIHNVLKGHCSIKKKHICKKFDNIQKEVEKVVNPKGKLSVKRKILTSQSGEGIFTSIASTVLPFLLNLLSRKNKK